MAAARHRAGLRRLVALRSGPLKYLERTSPTCRRWPWPTCRWAPRKSCASRSSTWRWTAPSCSTDPLPASEAAFKRRVDEGGRSSNLIAQRWRGWRTILLSGTPRRCASSRTPRAPPMARHHPAVGCAWCLTLPGGHALLAQLQHFARYLKAIVLRLDKLRADPDPATPIAWPTSSAGATLGTPGGRAQRARRRSPGRTSLAAGGTAGELLRQELRAAAGERQTAGQGLGQQLSPRSSCRRFRRPGAPDRLAPDSCPGGQAAAEEAQLQCLLWPPGRAMAGDPARARSPVAAQQARWVSVSMPSATTVSFQAAPCR